MLVFNLSCWAKHKLNFRGSESIRCVFFPWATSPIMGNRLIKCCGKFCQKSPFIGKALLFARQLKSDFLSTFHYQFGNSSAVYSSDKSTKRRRFFSVLTSGFAESHHGDGIDHRMPPVTLPCRSRCIGPDG